MSWDKVGKWIKENAGSGAALVGSILTGNIPGAVAAGVSMVSSATGTDDPAKALEQLQSNPETLLKLKELAFKEEDSIREHVRSMKEMELIDQQKNQEQTQLTIRNGDNAEGNIKWVRPSHASISLAAAIYYALFTNTPDIAILGALLTLPFTYSGLREFGKGSFGTLFKPKTK